MNMNIFCKAHAFTLIRDKQPYLSQTEVQSQSQGDYIKLNISIYNLPIDLYC